jgi:hypothetical protein
MEVVSNLTFRAGDEVRADRKKFVNCRFEGVQLRYGGGTLPEFVDCSFDESGWYFDEAALRTIQLLQAIGNGDGGRLFIDDLFKPGNYIGE